MSTTEEIKSTHDMTSKYVVLQECNEAEMETWLYFIKYEGNEKNLDHLKKQLEKIEMFMIEGCSTFDIDTNNLVSAQTAKEMTKVELNAFQWHRKFDGKLKKISLHIKDDDDEETKICKVFEKLGYGQIEEYIDDEDIDSCDVTVTSECNSDDLSDVSMSELKERSVNSSDDSDDDTNDDTNEGLAMKLPPSITIKMKKKKK